ncbi:MAG TPA: S8 family serine peptidase, partial [Candidatus Glassbacteria bacterium]|nr:S8 family serine peptidase [Candidatus Glassbacteria bacterium]
MLGRLAVIALASLTAFPTPGGLAQPAAEVPAGWTVRADTRLVALWRQHGFTTAVLASAKAVEGKLLRVVVSLEEAGRAYGLPGFRPTVARGTVAAGYLDLDRLPELAGSPEVRYVRPERFYQPTDLTGALSVRAVRVAERWGIDGQGVAIGVIDTGLDWSHPDFSRPDGTSRVLSVLDLSDSADSLKGGELGQPGPYGGIAVYKQQIEQALADKGKIRQKDFMGHGTLVAG